MKVTEVQRSINFSVLLILRRSNKRHYHGDGKSDSFQSLDKQVNDPDSLFATERVNENSRAIQNFPGPSWNINLIRGAAGDYSLGAAGEKSGRKGKRTKGGYVYFFTTRFTQEDKERIGGENGNENATTPLLFPAVYRYSRHVNGIKFPAVGNKECLNENRHSVRGAA